jgi:hypothetical protein
MNNEMRARLLAIAGRSYQQIEGVVGVVSVAHEESAKTAEYGAVSTATRTTPTTPSETLVGQEADSIDVIERAAVMEIDGCLPREIAAGLAGLCAMPAPTGFTTERWEAAIDQAARFADEWGAKALALGWTPEELFGLHPIAAAARYDVMGLAFSVQPGGHILTLTEDCAVIETASGSRNTFRRRPDQGNAVLAWGLLAA